MAGIGDLQAIILAGVYFVIVVVAMVVTIVGKLNRASKRKGKR